MEGIIRVLNVGDGDAIIVALKKEKDNLVMVIDGGHKGSYQQLVKPELEKILKEFGKKAPDIVVATHHDSDHIGGLIPLLEDYIKDINEVWVHPLPHLSESDLKILENFNLNIQENGISQYLNEKLIIGENKKLENKIRGKADIILESVKQLKDLLILIPDEKLRHVFSGYEYKGWSEIKVLGPTEHFYNELFPESLNLSSYILNESIDFRDPSFLAEAKRSYDLATHGTCPCESLKDESTAKLTATNQASIIIAIDKDIKRHLFTGDAGIKSFKAVPNWREELANLHWLKIPHHGSDNNMSKEIIDVMNPENSFNSGDRHQDQSVLDCISKNERCQDVSSTKDLVIDKYLEFKI